MISSLLLKFGRASGVQPTPIPTTAVTVFVGPNNSGKSKVLSEIEQYCRSGHKTSLTLILDDLVFSGFSADKAAQSIENIKVAPNPGECVQVDDICVGSKFGLQHVSQPVLTRSIQVPSTNLAVFCQ